MENDNINGEEIAPEDFKAMFEIESEKRKKAEYALYMAKKEKKEVKQVEEEAEVETTTQPTTPDLTQYLSGIDESEHDLYKKTLNDIKLSGNVQDDLRKAKAIVNAELVEKEKEELLRLKNETNNMNNTYSGASSAPAEPKLNNNSLISPAVEQQMNARGWSEDMRKRYVEKLQQASGGNISTRASWWK